ncbi:uncharacterized protein VTP21DRAFT_675 [Calcarisporiella thermophila]|uniref:uncharacterized protein n=1 Tax=Calcarisporiella thermophila TaxID=911321 RepID=UPI0037426690
MLDDKYIGLLLAISSSLLIGVSFIITKKGLIEAASDGRNGTASDTYSYFQNSLWWLGMITMALGEVANFAAYSFAPAILVTPLGALSVLIGAILASFLLKEELGNIGKVGCMLCLIGSIVIVLHAPKGKDIQTVDEILYYAFQPAFIFYFVFVVAFSSFMIFQISPKYGKKNPLVYLSICSLVGSISVMSVQGFGIALKLTFAGNNQFSHPSTYVFMIITVLCILTQLNYFNRALDTFSTSVVNPIYYVFFTTATIIASVILYQGFNTTSTVEVASLFSGFLTIFAGVYLLNSTRTTDNARESALLDRLPRPSLSLSIHRHHPNGSVSNLTRMSFDHNPGPNGVVRAGGGGDGEDEETIVMNSFEEDRLGLTAIHESDHEYDTIYVR